MTRTKTLFALAVGLVLAGTPAWADFRTERRLALEPGRTFTLNADVGSVTLTGDSTSGAMVTVTSRRDDFNEMFDLRFDEGPGGVTVTAKRRGGWIKGLWNSDWSSDNTQFVVHVPSNTTVTIKTAGGSVAVTQLNGRLTANTSGGSVRAEEIGGPVEGGDERRLHQDA